MSDVALQADRDVPDLDTTWGFATGAELAAQNIVEAIFTSIGSLPWDRDHGSTLFDLLNDVVPPALVIAEIRRVALEVEDIQPQSLVVTYHPDRGERGEYHIGFVGARAEPGTAVVSV